MSESVVFVRRPHPEELGVLAAILVDAFPRKVSRLFGRRADLAVDVVKELLITEHARSESLGAGFVGESLAGALVLQYRGIAWHLSDWGRLAMYAWRHIGPARLLRLLPSGLAYHAPRKDEAYVLALAVSEWARGQGVGTRLLRYAEAQARAHGCALVGLHVALENHGARRLYERLGYTRVGTQRTPLVTRMLGYTRFLYMTKVLAT